MLPKNSIIQYRWSGLKTGLLYPQSKTLTTWLPCFPHQTCTYTLFDTMLYFFVSVVLVAFQYWLDHCHSKFIWTSAFAIIIFRSELCILLGLILLLELVTRRLSLLTGFCHAALAGVSALGESGNNKGKLLNISIATEYSDLLLITSIHKKVTNDL